MWYLLYYWDLFYSVLYGWMRKSSESTAVTSNVNRCRLKLRHHQLPIQSSKVSTTTISVLTLPTNHKSLSGCTYFVTAAKGIQYKINRKENLGEKKVYVVNSWLINSTEYIHLQRYNTVQDNCYFLFMLHHFLPKVTVFIDPRNRVYEPSSHATEATNCLPSLPISSENPINVLHHKS